MTRNGNLARHDAVIERDEFIEVLIDSKEVPSDVLHRSNSAPKKPIEKRSPTISISQRLFIFY